MSKLRSKLMNSQDVSQGRPWFTTANHFGKRAGEMPGNPNHDASKSTVTMDTEQLHELVALKASFTLCRGTGSVPPLGRQGMASTRRCRPTIPGIERSGAEGSAPC
jgi:hypothetical protein